MQKPHGNVPPTVGLALPFSNRREHPGKVLLGKGTRLRAEVAAQGYALAARARASGIEDELAAERELRHQCASGKHC